MHATATPALDAIATVQSAAAAQKRAVRREAMRNAVAFAGTGMGRAMMAGRRVLGVFGPLGAAAVALYPVAAAAGLVIASFALTGHASPL